MNCEDLKGSGNVLVGIESEIKAKGWDSDLLIQNINNQLKVDIHESVIQHCIIKSRLVKGKEIIVCLPSFFAGKEGKSISQLI